MSAAASDVGRFSVVTSTDPVTFLHCAIFLSGGSVLGDETFRLNSLQGEESVSSPFSFELRLHGNTSAEGSGNAYRFADIVGRPVSVGISRASTRDDAEQAFRKSLDGETRGDVTLFNGIAGGFSMREPGVYSLSMKPALWKLTLTNRYRLHEGMNIRDAIAGVLDTHEIRYSMDGVGGSDNPALTRVQDWFQAGETDYEFVQRLMGKVHLYYYFEHSGRGHRMMIANRPNYPKALPDGRALRYTHTSFESDNFEQSDVITDYGYQQNLVSSGVRSVFARQDSAWEDDTVAGVHTFAAQSAADTGELPFHLYRIFQYGSSDSEVHHYTSATSDTLQTSATELSASSECAELRCGYKFQVAGPADGIEVPNNPVRPGLDGQWFVATHVTHNASGDGKYHNEFKATEASGLITAFSVQDTHQGSVVATVVEAPHDTSGAASPSDWRYYRKTAFDPVRRQIRDASASPATVDAQGVYVRFTTAAASDPPVWVKLAPHMQSAPEIGVTVLVSRSQDDSELPEIQSTVQANGQKTVTPSQWTASTQVGSNYSTSYGDSKSVRFGLASPADLDQAVGIVTAAYKSGEYRDASYSQGGSYSYSTADRGRGGLLSRSKSIGSSYSEYEGAENKSWSDIGLSYNESRIGRSESYGTITGESISEQTVEGDSHNKSTLKKNSYSTSRVDGKSESTSVTGPTTSSSVVNGAQISDSTVNGLQMSSSLVTGISLSNNMVLGASNSFSLTAASASQNLVGAHFGLSATGTSTDIGATGASTHISASGASTQISATGVGTNISLTKMSNTVDIADFGIYYKSAPGVVDLSNKGTDIQMPSVIVIIL